MNPKVDKWVRKAGSWCEKACPRTHQIYSILIYRKK